MNKLVHAWGTWCSFTQRERSQWLQAWLLLPLVTFGLRVFSLRRMQMLLSRLVVATPSQVDLPAAEALARIFYSAVRKSFLPYSCLGQSLVFQWLLRRQGLAADLRIGVAKTNGLFTAHAWVEHRGVALEENEMNRQFTAFSYTFASSQRREI
jgi:hypothetical protein